MRAVEHEVAHGGADRGEADEGVEERDELRELGHLGLRADEGAERQAAAEVAQDLLGSK